MKLFSFRILLGLILYLVDTGVSLQIMVEKDYSHSLFIDLFNLERVTCSSSILSFLKVTASNELFLYSCGRIHYLVWTGSIS